jgi:uncharacterized protein (UPF0261 family)
MKQPTILLVGTLDTKADEIHYMRRCIEAAGATALLMDVGVLGTPRFAPEITNEQVARAAGVTLARVAASADENEAMALMARGASALVGRLHDEGNLQGLIALGGTMGTDLALEVSAALPLGVPKLIVSTVAYSHLIPPDRIPPDLMMILWAGGLYGLNPLCESALSQAVGAVVGACRTSALPSFSRPLVGMTSLGKSCLSYMVRLKPALEERGYEVAVFHTTGMGGRVFEALASDGRFVAVLDLSLQEISNQVHGSVVSSGEGRLEAAGRAGIPQIVAPGAIDMIDFPAWQAPQPEHAGRPYHAHNRLIASVTATAEERRMTARAIAHKLSAATGPTALILPLGGIEEWDRPGQALHDAVALKAFMDEMRAHVAPRVELVELQAHINDTAFTTCVMQVFDRWVGEGRIRPGGKAVV